MKRKIRSILLLVAGVLLASGLAYTFWPTSSDTSLEKREDNALSYLEEEEGDKMQNIKDAFEDNFRRTLDPALGYPPYERMLTTIENTRRQQQAYLNSSAYRNGGLGDARWRERGPNNIGGRTRTILIDQNDPSRSKIWAAGVSGGVWYTNDITEEPVQWEKVNDYLENLAVTALAQDPNNPQVMYLGTGEGFGNFDAVRGVGLFKSTNGGQNWTILPNTRNNNFRFTQNLLVHPVTSDIYAATSEGLWRSQDGGDNWTKVLGGNVGFANSFFYDVKYAESINTIYASNRNAIFKSTTGNPNDWDNLTGTGSNFPSGLQRVELAFAPSNPNLIYIIGAENIDVGGQTVRGSSRVYFSPNGGQTWQQRTRPTFNDGSEFTRGQAWYDLDIAVHPTNPTQIIAGGVILRSSSDGGLSWQPYGQGTHVDQHIILFDEANPNIVYVGNDGGVYRIVNGQVEDKNFGYNVTQFYACAIHPGEGTNYFLGGTQDNNSLQLSQFGVSSGRAVRGGDGFACHIDENEPEIQIVSSQFGNYGLSLNGGQSFGGGASVNGGFYNPSDYDSDRNILYTQTFDGDYYRWEINTGNLDLVDITGFNINVSTVHVDPNVPGRVYFGTYGGQIIRVDSAYAGVEVEGEALSNLSGVISSVDVELGDPDHLLVTISNFGLTSVFESFNGGDTWLAVEGNLPDMPVRWGIFNPNDNRSAMIGTEAGVWITEELDGSNTTWLPPLPGRGTPLVRVDMLQLRRSDRVVLAGTHGRGMFTSDVFSSPAARMALPTISYTQVPITFVGEISTGADDYLWEFGDGATAVEENPVHIYTNFGTFPVQLTINNELSVDSVIQILPDQAVPYQAGEAGYAGDFESGPEQYGVENLNGSAFVRTQSTFPGKNGANSGEFAWVLGPEEEFYQPNTHARLYLPNFDLSDQTIYTFRFWSKFRIHQGFDGFRVEYSTDRGQSWRILGSADEPNWYNFTNTNLDNGVFPINTPYFTGNRNQWQQFSTNISFLAGERDVAFRFVFRSDGVGNHTGVAIDDVEVTKFDGEPITKLLRFEGEYSSPEEITVEWTTQPEFKAVRFELERSTDGRNFELLETLPATGGSTADLQSYASSSLSQRSLYFFRLKVINEDPAIGYSYEFYSPVIVVRRNLEGTDVLRLFPNPFTDRIEITFNNFLDRPVPYSLYDISGRLLQEGQLASGAVFGSIETGGKLQFGTYVLVLRIDGEEEKAYKLIGGAR